MAVTGARMSLEKNSRGSLTMADLAKLAGVSKITVSRALSNSSSVKLETRERIREIAAAQGYQMNVAARNLRQGKTHTILVVVEMTPSHSRPMSGPYPVALIGGMMQELAAANFNLMLSNMSNAIKSPPVVDAIVLLGQGPHDDGVGELERFGLPLVIWGAVREGSAHVTIGSDNLCGGGAVAERLFALGRRKLVFLGDPEYAEIADRYDGFAAKAAELGASVIGKRAADFTFVSGYDAMEALVAEHGSEIDGVFASSDAIAMGAVRSLYEHGRAIPADVSVIGFDNSIAASQFVPPLTTVRQHWHEGGERLARAALSLIQGEKVASQQMPTELIIRSS